MSDEANRIIRSDAIYVSWQTRKALSYIPRTDDDLPNSDAIAEKVLAVWLKAKHPDIVAHIKAQHEADQAFKESIKSKLPF